MSYNTVEFKLELFYYNNIQLIYTEPMQSYITQSVRYTDECKKSHRLKSSACQWGTNVLIKNLVQIDKFTQAFDF